MKMGRGAGGPDILGAWTTVVKHHGIGSIQKIMGEGERTVKLTRSYSYCGSGKQRQTASSAVPMPHVVEFFQVFTQMVQIMDQITYR
jgi:hypothetical protein